VRVLYKARRNQENEVKLIPFQRTGIFLNIVVMLIVSAAWVSAQTKTTKTSTTATEGSPASTANPKAIGSPNAPITMEIFGDFECPACRAFYEATLKQVIDDYVVPGKVYMIYRDFPLDMHPYARPAAQLANAAAHFGQFQAIERALYDNQDAWSAKGNIDDVIASSFPPGQLKKFRDYETQHINEINASIEHDRTMGIQRNVNQTPTVFITAHGKTEPLPGGGVDYKLLKNYFDYLLRQ
jgi:protein-disulfide isomerase